MSNQYLNTITENASRLGMRLQESFSEHTRDLNLSRGTAAAYFDDDRGTKNIRKQLESNSDREKLDAMKRLIALISKNRNVSDHFAAVVKNVASQNLEIRKLVYIYLLRYAEQEPDLALLSINTFQRDLADPNPLIRAMALRVLSGIRVPMVGSVVVMGIKKCAADPSPYVRKAAGMAVPKCYDLDSSHLPSLLGILTTLLADRSPLALGSVAAAFSAVCPTRLDLVHPHFRRLCRVLVDVDEWGQVELMGLLLRYARNMLPKPGIGNQAGTTKVQEREDAKSEDEEIDKDIRLLLNSVEPVLQSRNPAVVLAATRVLYYAGPPSYHPKIVHPLLRLLSLSIEVERVVLAYLNVISRTNPQLFALYYTRFIVRSNDLRQIKLDKIRLLLNVLTTDNYLAILREFVVYSDDTDDQVVAAAIRGLGRCAHLIPESMQQCSAALITMIKNPHDMVVSNAVLILKHLIQTQLVSPTTVVASTSKSPLSVIAHLARRIDDIQHPQARACVLWLVGQYAASDEPGPGPEGLSEWAPDVLRKGAKMFRQEAPLVKLQVVTLAAKLFVLCPTDQRLIKLSQYIFSLARYDSNYDVRDRARMVSSLLIGVSPTSLVEGTGREERGGVILRREQVRLVLFDGKTGVVDDETCYSDGYNPIIGTLGVVTGKPMRLGDEALPEWLENGVESSLRDTAEELAPAPAVPLAFSSQQIRGVGRGVPSPIVLTPTNVSRPSSRNGGTAKGPWTDLDKFYEDTATAESASEDDEDEGSEDEGESESEESDGEDVGESGDEESSQEEQSIEGQS